MAFDIDACTGDGVCACTRAITGACTACAGTSRTRRSAGPMPIGSYGVFAAPGATSGAPAGRAPARDSAIVEPDELPRAPPLLHVGEVRHRAARVADQEL